MGLFKRLLGVGQTVVDPNDLRLPDEISTNKSGLVLRKAPLGKLVEIDIVGESFRAANIAAVANAAQGNEFDIYLVAEPTNPHDKKAVAVYAANVHIGYIAKPGNTQWFKWVNEALERKELLWGPARAISAQGTRNTGVFGSIYMPRVGRDIEELIPQKMTDSALRKAIEKVIALSNSCVEPDTIAQLKSLSKKAAGVATPIAAHAKWLELQVDGPLSETWSDVKAACDDLLDAFSEAAYAADETEVDIVDLIETLAEMLGKIEVN
jgi:hypothetical protein